MTKFNIYDKVTPIVNIGCEENGPKIGTTYIVANVSSSKDTLYLNGFGARFSAARFRLVAQTVSRDGEGNPLYVGDLVKVYDTLCTVIRGNDFPRFDWVSVRFGNGKEGRYISGAVTLHSSSAEVVKDKDVDKLAWNMVEEGDTATAINLDTGTEVTDVIVKPGDWTLFMGWATKNGNLPLKFELLSFSKPKPKLPTANGSIIRALPSGSETHLIGCRWRWADGGSHAEPGEWVEGNSGPTSWELVRDPSQEAKSNRD